jgi:hypothetical protein
LVGFVAVAWQLFNALLTKEVRMRSGGVVRRDDKPIAFWLLIVFHLPILAGLFWIVLSRAQQALTN